jgi:hypothetical protein
MLRSNLLTLCCLVALGAAAPLWGQAGASSDVTGYAGFYHESGATKAILGVAVGKFVSKRAEFVGDLGYVPFGYGGNQVLVSGGFDLLLTRVSKQVVPYIPIRAGFARYWEPGYNWNSPIFGGGLGARCLIGRNWGLRPELQYIRYQKSEGGFNAMRMTFGVFYAFGR